MAMGFCKFVQGILPSRAYAEGCLCWKGLASFWRKCPQVDMGIREVKPASPLTPEIAIVLWVGVPLRLRLGSAVLWGRLRLRAVGTALSRARRPASRSQRRPIRVSGEPQLHWLTLGFGDFVESLKAVVDDGIFVHHEHS